MAQLSARAEQQVTTLIRHYAKVGRFEAIDGLNKAMEAALASVGREVFRARSYPATYAGLADLGLSWLRVGRYWFGYKHTSRDVVITNVFYDQANMPRRVRP